MSSFRSNLNSTSGTHDGLTAIQSRLTTCFKHLRRKFNKIEQHFHAEGIKPQEFLTNFHINQKEQQQPLGSQTKWYQPNYKDSRFLQKANENLRNFTNKLKEIFLGRHRFSQSKDLDYEKEIIAKLVSSTLIARKAAAATQFDFSASVTTIATKTTVVGVDSKMTIVGDSFLGIREEYPELDAEIRSILIARAQTGATIGEIKEDYRKNTGLRFPVYRNVTDFLLCIPGVMAYCTESGTRIFNVKPNEKTKHIHDMVTHQKAPSERFSYGSSCRSDYVRDSGFGSNLGVQYARRDNNFGVKTVNPTWRSNNFFRKPEQNAHGTLIASSSFRNIQQQQPQQQEQFFPPTNSVDDNNSRSESDGFVENRGGYYRDNCQYLYNRIYNYENDKNNEKSNNIIINDDQNLIVPRDADAPIDVQTSQSDLNDKDAHLFKRPIGRPVRGSVIRASSPSGTGSSQSRSCSDSIFSTEMDYEAHLLDFPLLGDDFLLYLARMELRCKFKKNQKVLQSGLCVSGQTIKAAAKRFRSLPFNGYGNRRIIVNIGSVDIMQGKTLVQIEHDFRNLINIINKRGYQPILTTLAPLANFAHDSMIKLKVDRFNDFIKREGQFLLVIDIASLFVTERKQILFDCYQNEPRQVTGAKESYVFWNKIGRQRVLQMIESNLEY